MLTNQFMPKINVGQEDPFFVQDPSGKKRKKVKKPIPPGLSKKDAKILKKVRRKAHRLDLAFDCCCGMQVGLAGIIQLVPWIGDIVAAFLAYRLVQLASQIDGGLPEEVYSKMMGNVVFDFTIGLIPIVGDLVNIAYKCNSRNTLLLENHLVDRYKLRPEEMHLELTGTNEAYGASRIDGGNGVHHDSPPSFNQTGTSQAPRPAQKPGHTQLGVY